MRILHFADYHIGADRRGQIDPITRMNLRVLDYIRSLDAIVDYIQCNKIDIVIFAGDLFHTNNPQPDIVVEVSKRISIIKDCCSLYMIPGNHDIRRINTSTILDLYPLMSSDNVIVADSASIHTVQDIPIVSLPYENIKFENGSSKSAYYRKLLKSMKCTDGILVAHMTLQGAMYGEERNYSFDKDDVNLDALCDNDWIYIALGHIHKHQIMSEEPLTVYSGSIERVSFNEEGQSKGFIVLDISDDAIDFNFVELDTRKFMTIELDVTKTKNLQDKLLEIIAEEDLVGAIARIIINADDTLENYPFNIKRINDFALSKSAIISSTIVNRQKAIANTRLEALGGEVLDKTVEDLLKLYFIDMGIDNKEIKHLQNLANDIINGE